MLFRNLTLFRFPSAVALRLRQLARVVLEDSDQGDVSGLADALSTAALKPVGPLEMQSRGFVSPFGRGDEALSHQVGDCVLITLGGEDKLLPSAVVNEALAIKLDAVREREGRNPGGRERKRIKDEVLTDLLPRAFARPGRCNAYLDLGEGWLVVDTSSRKRAEQVTTALREALESFPALPVNAECSPRALMTAWLSGEPLPEGFELGDESELRDPVDAGAIVKVSRQELDSDEVREHLKAGKQGFRLALIFEKRLSFVIGEDMVIRKLRFLETATEALEKDERDSLRAEIDATFALMSLELKRLLQRLAEEFSLSKADA